MSADAANPVRPLSHGDCMKIGERVSRALGRPLDDNDLRDVVSAVHAGYSDCGLALVVLPAQDAADVADMLDLAVDLLSDSPSDAAWGAGAMRDALRLAVPPRATPA